MVDTLGQLTMDSFESDINSDTLGWFPSIKGPLKWKNEFYSEAVLVLSLYHVHVHVDYMYSAFDWHWDFKSVFLSGFITDVHVVPSEDSS